MSSAASPAVDVRTRFDLERMRIAYEQSTQSWIRTGTSLITFGFSIYKFFQIEDRANVERTRLVGPREFSMLLVIIGLAALALATLEHRRNLQFLRQQYPDMRRSLAGLLAGLISVLGILAFVAMIFRQ